MKKLLLIMLLTFTTFANADERYSIAPEPKHKWGGVWIVDNKKDEMRWCYLYKESAVKVIEIACTKWEELR